ncbi:MAG: PQQ-dependent sugar dehydrogenase [Cyclobacteriaceae bacterium]
MNKYVTFKQYFLWIICLAIFTISCSEAESEPDLLEEPVIEDPIFELVGDSLTMAIYRNNCGGCHGQNLSSFVARDWKYGNDTAEVIASIKDGYPENGMPAYGETLSEAEINSLAVYILNSVEGKTKEMLDDENPDLSGLIESDDMNFRLETLSDQIAGVPWAIVQLPNADLLVTERSGKLYRITNNNELQTITGVPSVNSSGQGGLLDVAIDPDFANNSLVYLSYSKRNPQNANQQTTAVARGKLAGNALTDMEDIFIALPYHNTTRHYGSRMLFDREGYLYVSVGDRGSRDQFPQALDNQIGKVHRLNADGSIPSDNPFVNTSNANNSIYSYGIRNPQGLSLHPVTGDIWEGEHGPQGGDEINILQPGNNYGWPVISYGINYDGTPFTELTEKEGMEQPIHYWTPSIAPCGMDFVDGDFYLGWKNDLLVSSLKFQYLHRLKMDGNKVVGQEELLEDIGRIRDVHMGIDGYIYLAVEGPGRVFRLVPEY